MGRRAHFAGVAILALASAVASAGRPAARVLTAFDEAAATGASHNPLQRPPSTVVLERVAEGSGQALAVSGTSAPGGLAGVWVAFYDVRAARKQFVDATGYEFLTFRVRSGARAPRLIVKVADAAWASKEDAFEVGELTRLLPQDIGPRWQQVTIPLGGLPLDRKALAGLTLVVDGPGDFSFAIDDVALKRDPEDSLPIASAVATPPRAIPPRALWHWEAKRHVGDPARWADFLAFCRRQGIDRVWMQLPERLRPDSPIAAQLRARLGEAHRAGVAVEALDGFPEHGLREHHAVPLAAVDEVIAFNARAGGAGERFDGIHLDNEIHLLLGWHSARLRGGYMTEFLELNAEAQRRVRGARGLTFGVDIPFWWSAAELAVEWNGRRHPVGLHLVDMLDTVGVMDYRDRAEGADGILAHAMPFVSRAGAAGRARVFIGVETFRSLPAPVWLALGLPRARFEEALDGPARGLARSSRLDGLRLRAFDDGERVHAGVELPPSPSAADEARAMAALRTIARTLGAGAGEAGPARDRALARMRDAASELVDGSARDFVDTATGARIPGIAATAIMLPKITFADDGVDDLRRELAAVESALARSPGFAGIALHYYEPYRALVEPRGVP